MRQVILCDVSEIALLSRILQCAPCLVGSERIRDRTVRWLVSATGNLLDLFQMGQCGFGIGSCDVGMALIALVNCLFEMCDCFFGVIASPATPQLSSLLRPAPAALAQ